jgi:hypothetical protein
MIGLIIVACVISGAIGCSIGVVLMCLVSIQKEDKRCINDYSENEYGI